MSVPHVRLSNIGERVNSKLISDFRFLIFLHLSPENSGEDDRIILILPYQEGRTEQKL